MWGEQYMAIESRYIAHCKNKRIALINPAQVT